MKPFLYRIRPTRVAFILLPFYECKINKSSEWKIRNNQCIIIIVSIEKYIAQLQPSLPDPYACTIKPRLNKKTSYELACY